MQGTAAASLYIYGISGLTVGSAIALPGLVPVGAGATPDVSIAPGAVPAALDEATDQGPTADEPLWQIAGDRFLIHIPGVARFLLSAGNSITVAPEANADPADIPVFILGTVFGILLHQRRQIVLHASAVQVNGRAIVFCGPSGAGKSTLAAALAQRGLPLVTDDVCALSIAASGVPMVQPDSRQLKLSAEAIDRLHLTERRGARVRKPLEKFYVAPATAHDRALGTLPLAAIYALREARPPHTTGIDRPNVVDAALLLRRNAYRPQLVERMGQRGGYFHAATAIANRAGIFTLTRPLTFEAMPGVVDMLERHWRDIGLTGRAA